eukprot:scaffold597_cov55-Phaeocystis_antarctica.AAC.1
MLSFLYSSRMRWSLNWLRRRSCVVIRVRVRSCGVGLLRGRQAQRGVLASGVWTSGAAWAASVERRPEPDRTAQAPGGHRSTTGGLASASVLRGNTSRYMLADQQLRRPG